MVSEQDERAHEPTAPHWQEAWSFEFAAPGGSFGGYARLTLAGPAGRAWFSAAVTGPDRSTVAVRDHDIDPPRAGGLEVRAPGLWADVFCEAALDHWSVGLEALAVAFDDPTEAWGAERGVPVPLGFDLGWEAAGPPVESPQEERRRYDQSCRVEGEVLIGGERVRVDAWGARAHEWGPCDWAGRAPYGHASVCSPDGQDILVRPANAAWNDGGLPVAISFRPSENGDEITAEPLAHAPVLIPLPGGGSRRLARSLCRWGGPGSGGCGWAEFLLGP